MRIKELSFRLLATLSAMIAALLLTSPFMAFGMSEKIGVVFVIVLYIILAVIFQIWIVKRIAHKGG